MIHPREAEIRQALAEHPELDDRQIGAIAGIRRWSKVRLVREAMAAEAAQAAPPPAPAAVVEETPPAPRCPPLGLGAALARALLETRLDDPMLRQQLRRACLRARAIDFGIFEERRP